MYICLHHMSASGKLEKFTNFWQFSMNRQNHHHMEKFHTFWNLTHKFFIDSGSDMKLLMVFLHKTARKQRFILESLFFIKFSGWLTFFYCRRWEWTCVIISWYSTICKQRGEILKCYFNKFAICIHLFSLLLGLCILKLQEFSRIYMALQNIFHILIRTFEHHKWL